MTVTINGRPHDFDGRPSVAEVLESLRIRREQGVAVALNFAVLPRHTFESTRLESGDELEIIRPTAGG